MENYGVIIRHLRLLAGLSVQQAARKLGRSIGWLSEIPESVDSPSQTTRQNLKMHFFVMLAPAVSANGLVRPKFGYHTPSCE